MKQVKWLSLIYAILSAASIAAIGITIAAESIIGFAGSALVLIIIMGLGFSRKKKLREKGEI